MSKSLTNVFGDISNEEAVEKLQRFADCVFQLEETGESIEIAKRYEAEYKAEIENETEVEKNETEVEKNETEVEKNETEVIDFMKGRSLNQDDLNFFNSLPGEAVNVNSNNSNSKYSEAMIDKNVYMNYRSRFSLCMYWLLTGNKQKCLNLINDALKHKVPLHLKTFKYAIGGAGTNVQVKFTEELLKEVLGNENKTPEGVAKVNQIYDFLKATDDRIVKLPGKRTRTGGQ